MATKGAESWRARAEEVAAALASLQRSEDERMVVFLMSWEFEKMVTGRAFAYFQTEFDKCRGQFEKAGLILPDQEDFLDIDRAIASLLIED